MSTNYIWLQKRLHMTLKTSCVSLTPHANSDPRFVLFCSSIKSVHHLCSTRTSLLHPLGVQRASGYNRCVRITLVILYHLLWILDSVTGAAALPATHKDTGQAAQDKSQPSSSISKPYSTAVHSEFSRR